MKKKDNKNNWNNNYKASRFRDYSFDSASGRKVDPLYTSDSSSIDEEEIGFPG